MSPARSPELSSVLAESVFAGGRAKPFAEMTAGEVSARAEELREAVGWGPTARVAGVARAWGELGRLMAETGAAVVSDLAPEQVTERAERLWIVPPGGSLL